MEDVLLGRRPRGIARARLNCARVCRDGRAPVHATELLIAFRQDATKRRYATCDELSGLLPLLRRAGRPLRDRSARREKPTATRLRAVRRAVHFAANIEPFAGLRRRPADARSLLHSASADAASPASARAICFAPAETPALRRVFITLLERVDQLNLDRARTCPTGCETGGCGRRRCSFAGWRTGCGTGLAQDDPLAARVELTKADGITQPAARAGSARVARNEQPLGAAQADLDAVEAWCAPPAPRSIAACGCCRRTGATRCMRSTRSAASWTTSPTKRGTLAEKLRAWRHGAPASPGCTRRGGRAGDPRAGRRGASASTCARRISSR